MSNPPTLPTVYGIGVRGGKCPTLALVTATAAAAGGGGGVDADDADGAGRCVNHSWNERNNQPASTAFYVVASAAAYERIATRFINQSATNKTDVTM